jgi:hypothetical protein
VLCKGETLHAIALPQNAKRQLPASIPPNGTLSPFVVVFSPSGPGVRTGQILVQDDAPGNPHTIPLQGFGVAVAPGDFAILAQNNMPLATSVAAGGTATYSLVVTGNPNTITLKRTGALQGGPHVTCNHPSLLTHLPSWVATPVRCFKSQ